jgi:hypothetical protein
MIAPSTYHPPPRRLAARQLLLGLIAAMVLLPQDGQAQALQDPATTPPVLAYYYIWFSPESWNRAKLDLPLLGPYDSGDETVIRQHVRWAKASGIDGFIVSWKHTDVLSGRLATLVRVAGEEDFKLQIIYEALDFWRHPLPVNRIASDLDWFAETYGDNPVFDLFGQPVVIWSGTWKFDREEIARVTDPRRDRLQILASEKQPGDYEQIADLVDGNAYYWSSVDPKTHPGYADKLVRMADVVHTYGGLWIAPAAPGFDARHLGGQREVLRHDGETLEAQFQAALGSNPDAIGLISWNEFSENSHVEPSCNYGDQYLAEVARLSGGEAPVVDIPCDVAALATAQAGAVPGTPSSPGSENLVVVQSDTFDWDSSAPGGVASTGARLSVIAMMGVVVGFMGFSIVQLARRAMWSQAGSSSTLPGAVDPPPDAARGDVERGLYP